jgi:hypothetical protein
MGLGIQAHMWCTRRPAWRQGDKLRHSSRIRGMWMPILKLHCSNDQVSIGQNSRQIGHV